MGGDGVVRLTCREARDYLDQEYRQHSGQQQQAGDGLQVKHTGIGSTWPPRTSVKITGCGALTASFVPLPPQLHHTLSNSGPLHPRQGGGGWGEDD